MLGHRQKNIDKRQLDFLLTRKGRSFEDVAFSSTRISSAHRDLWDFLTYAEHGLIALESDSAHVAVVQPSDRHPEDTFDRHVITCCAFRAHVSHLPVTPVQLVLSVSFAVARVCSHEDLAAQSGAEYGLFPRVTWLRLANQSTPFGGR